MRKSSGGQSHGICQIVYSRWLKWVILALLGTVMMAYASHALAGASSAAGGGTAMDSVTALREIAKGMDATLKSYKEKTALTSVGYYLIGFFLAVNLAWCVLKAMATGNGLNGFIADFVLLGLVTAVALACIDRNLASTIEKTIEQVGTALGFSSATLEEGIFAAMDNAFRAIVNVFSIRPITSELTGWKWVIAIIPSIMTTGLMVLGTVFFIVMATCIHIAMLIFSSIQISIAFMFAPFMVPFIMFQPASFLFDAWLRFLISATMMKLVGAVIAEISVGMLAKMQSVSVSAIQPENTNPVDAIANAISVDMLLYGTIMLLSGVSALMMMQIPAIANALVGGSATGFGGWGSMARGVGGSSMGKLGPKKPKGRDREDKPERSSPPRPTP